MPPKEATEERREGRELDAFIAEKVFGLAYIEEDGTYRSIVEGHDAYYRLESLAEDLPHYSTSIADAWLVVEKLTDYRWVIERGAIGWTVMLDTRNVFYTATGETAQMAICRAALSVQTDG